MVYTDLPCECDPYPIDDGMTIHSVPGAKYGATQATTRLNWRQVALQEDTHEGGGIWQHLLAIGGGGLALPKCNTSVFIPKFTTHNFGECLVTWKTMDEFPGHCYVQPFNEFLPLTKIKRIEPIDADKLLGLKMAMNGLFLHEYKRRKEEIDTLAATLAQMPFTRIEAFVLYASQYLPIIWYFLHHTCFSTQDERNLEMKWILAILTKLGYNRNMPRAVIFGPLDLGGTGLTKIEFEQIACQTEDLICTFR